MITLYDQTEHASGNFLGLTLLPVFASRVKATFQSVSAGVKKRAGQVNQRFNFSGKAQQAADRYQHVNMVEACNDVLSILPSVLTKRLVVNCAEQMA